MWWSGESVANLQLLGISIRAWGRFGKLLQLTAALVVVLDIAGPERIRRYGASLRNVVPQARLAAYFRGTWRWAWTWVVSLLRITSRSTVGGVTHHETSRFTVYLVISFVVGALASLFMPASYFADVTPTWVGHFMRFVLVWMLSIFFLPIVETALAFALIMFGLLVDGCLLRPLAAALERPTVDRIAKFGGLVALLIGSHFDLLAS